MTLIKWLKDKKIYAKPISERIFSKYRYYPDIPGNSLAWGTIRKYRYGNLVFKINSDELESALDKYMVLDIRDRHSFDSGHINGAMHLSPENISNFLKNFNPFGIDIASGVETEEKKDPEKIKKIVKLSKENS